MRLQAKKIGKNPVFSRVFDVRAQEVRSEGRPPRASVQQALIFPEIRQKCRPTGRHFSCAPYHIHGWGGANTPYKRFAAGKTLADTEPQRGVSGRNRRVAAALSAGRVEFTFAGHLNFRGPSLAI